MELIILNEQMKEEFTNSTTNRHLKAKPPKDAYFYIPRGVDVLEFDEKNPTQTVRKVFGGGVEYNYYEKIKLKELKKEIQRQKANINLVSSSLKRRSLSMELISTYNLKNSDLMRFLQAANYDLIRATESIANYVNWRKINIPPKVTDNSMKILNSGLIYIHGRDSRFRPIVVFVPSVYEKFKRKFSLTDFEMSVIYLTEYMINNLLLPGQVENWNIICDLQSFSLNSISVDLRKILSMLQNNYKCRLYVMYVINMSKFGVWSVVKKFVDHRVESKIRLIKSDNLLEMFTFINRSQVEKKFGGYATNTKNYFFPPIFPSDEYLMEDEKKSIVLIEEEIYKNIIRIQKELILSPYIVTEEEMVKDAGKVFEVCEANVRVIPENEHLQEANPNSEEDIRITDMIDLVDAERKQIFSSNRITNQVIKKNEKVLNMSTLQKHTGNSPYKLKDSYLISQSRKIQSKSHNTTPQKSLNTTFHISDDHLQGHSKFNHSNNNDIEPQNNIRVEYFHIVEDRETKKVCCNYSYKDCMIF